MSEVIEPGLEAMDRQNRFVSEHLRRIFVQIYRIVDNVADAQDLTQETFIKALQHTGTAKRRTEGRSLAVENRHKYGDRFPAPQLPRDILRNR